LFLCVQAEQGRVIDAVFGIMSGRDKGMQFFVDPLLECGSSQFATRDTALRVEIARFVVCKGVIWLLVVAGFRDQVLTVVDEQKQRVLDEVTMQRRAGVVGGNQGGQDIPHVQVRCMTNDRFLNVSALVESISS
jgi:hypothetical protein